MTKEEFDTLLAKASKEFGGKKKTPTTPAKQFEKGALWLWNLLKDAKDVTYFEQILHDDVENRLGNVEAWQESLITETAKMMARREDIENAIVDEGFLLAKWDKNRMPYKEANPLIAHLKELDRSIGMQREHLGLSFKVNPERMKESPRKDGGDDNSKMANWMKGRDK